MALVSLHASRSRTGAFATVVVVLALGAMASQGASATPTSDPVIPSAGAVSAARQAAARVNAEVASLDAQQQTANARLLTLQLRLSRAVTADAQAQQDLALAEAVARKAAASLAAAEQAQATARRAVAGQAALLWTHDTTTLATLDATLTASPEAASDLQFVLDAGSHQLSADLDLASSSAASTEARRTFLDAARLDRAAAADRARSARATAESTAVTASTEAAALAAEQQRLSTRRDTLQADAAALAADRTSGLKAQARARAEAAARAAARAASLAREQANRDRAAAAAAATATIGVGSVTVGASRGPVRVSTTSGGGTGAHQGGTSSTAGGAGTRGTSTTTGGEDTSGTSGSGGTSNGSSGGIPAGGRSPAGAQAAARSMMASYGWGDSQFPCLVDLWNGESGWSWSATNPSSGAYGIPQALPGWKMVSAGSDWLTNPTTQVRWGMTYIKGRYGSPCAARSTWLARSPTGTERSLARCRIGCSAPAPQRTHRCSGPGRGLRPASSRADRAARDLCCPAACPPGRHPPSTRRVRMPSPSPG